MHGELKGFRRLWSEKGDLAVAGDPPVFKVFKTVVERKTYAELLLGVRGYEFFEIQQRSKKPSEFDSEPGPNKDKRFWDKLSDLAWEIKEVLAQLTPNAPPRSSIGEQVFKSRTAAAQKAASTSQKPLTISKKPATRSNVICRSTATTSCRTESFPMFHLIMKRGAREPEQL